MEWNEKCHILNEYYGLTDRDSRGLYLINRGIKRQQVSVWTLYIRRNLTEVDVEAFPHLAEVVTRKSARQVRAEIRPPARALEVAPHATVTMDDIHPSIPARKFKPANPKAVKYKLTSVLAYIDIAINL